MPSYICQESGFKEQSFFTSKSLAAHLQRICVIALFDTCDFCCFFSSQANGQIDCHLYVWDVEMDTLQFFNFKSGHGEQDEFLLGENVSDREITQAEKLVLYLLSL